MHAPTRGILEEAVSCLRLLRAPSVVTVLGEKLCVARALGHRKGSISRNLNVNRLDKLNQSFLCKYKCSKPPLFLSPFPSLSFPTEPEMVLAIAWGLGGVEGVAILQSFPDLDPDQVVFLHRNLFSSLLSGHSQSLFQGAK